MTHKVSAPHKVASATKKPAYFHKQVLILVIIFSFRTQYLEIRRTLAPIAEEILFGLFLPKKIGTESGKKLQKKILINSRREKLKL